MKLRYTVSIVLLFLSMLVAQAFAQQDTSTAGLEFTDIESAAPVKDSGAAVSQKGNPAAQTIAPKKEGVHRTKALENAEKHKTLWAIFLEGFLGGFAALIMPCIFPMLPLTVSFFTKRAGSKAKGVSQAILYGVSIIVIYVLLGFTVSLIFGSDALNDLSTNGIFNFFFFLLLVVFGASFLGAFEITLPSSLVNKMDEKSDTNGVAGIFFMAFTLALVSFSCTGPIIGTLLVDAASKGERLAPILGMFGFSLALALPFTLFALFPSWLKALPKSGGWLNSVKVVLGFLELAFALKFLSNVDLAYHWNWFDREIFLSLWIVIFALMGLYLLGKLKFSHDSDLPYLSVTRAFLAIIVFAFVMYMVPGLWGAPLKSISAFLPPATTQDFDLYSNRNLSATAGTHQTGKKKNEEIFARATSHALGLDAYFDYEEALKASKELNKPVLLDFTGWNCVNCRKMESNVWSDPRVLKMLNEDFVLAELYVDDKTSLPSAEQFTSKYSGKLISTIGKKNSDFEASVFGSNSQPLYAIVNGNGELLVPAQGADYSADNYIEFLKSGLNAFK